MTEAALHAVVVAPSLVGSDDGGVIVAMNAPQSSKLGKGDAASANPSHSIHSQK